MKNLRKLALCVVLLLTYAGLHAQNGNATVSEVKVYDMGNGAGMMEVRISGNLSGSVHEGTFSVSGNRIAGGTATGTISESIRVIDPESPNGNGNGNINGNQAVILYGMFSLLPATGNGPDLVGVDVQIVRHHVGESDRYFRKAAQVNLWVAP